ncbi:MAG: hypothetical protein HGA51_11215, partial [Demequinaceae bacterium]|nr:hypothetical protein [Demequinaceae bacterium]
MIDLPVWPFIVLVGCLVVSAVARRHGWAWAAAEVAVVGTTVLYGASVTSAEVGLSFHATMAFLVGLAGLLALRDIAINGGPRAPQASALWIAVAPLAWLGAAAAGAFYSGGSRWDWALGGDSANNVLFSRDVIIDHGVSFAGTNPVPLPQLAVALGMSGEHSHSLASDIAAYVSVWHLLIVAATGSAGLLGRHVALRCGAEGRGVLAVATVLPAACVLSWAATGNAVQFGFINAHLAVTLVVLSLIVGLSAPNPSAGFVMQVMVAVDLLVTWSPLAAVPVVMAVFHLVAAFRGGLSRREWLRLGGGAVLGLGFAAATVVAAASALHGAFSSGGGVWAPSLRTSAAVILTLLVAGILISRSVRALGSWVMFAALALATALGGTLVLAGGSWTYYPMKMAWLAVVVAGVVLAALAAPGVAIIVPRLARLGPALAVAGGLIVVVGPPVLGHGTSLAPLIVEPFTRIVAPGDGGGDSLFRLVEALGTDDASIALLWGSGSANERNADFWVINESSARFSAAHQPRERFAVRALAYA